MKCRIQIKLPAWCTVLCVLLPFLFFPLSCPAQNPAHPGSFSGKVVEKGPGTPMEFVNVMVYDTLTKQLVKGSVTDADGLFTVEGLPYDKPLQATFSSMGFSTKTGRVFKLTSQKPSVNIGTLHMETAAQLLKAVNITGQKRTIEYSLDRKVVNVEQSLVSEGGSAIDVLENVPSISVDEEGNISMKGSESVTILIDGRPASFSGLGLDQISAANIANIEIISNPSAKYNPEGSSGIINIITKERKNSEINGNFNLSTSTSNRHGIGANLSFGFKKVTLFTNLDVNFRNREAHGYSNRTSYRNSDIFLEDNIEKEMQTQSDWGRLGAGGKFQLGTDIKITQNDLLLISGSTDYWWNNRFSASPGTRTFSFNDAFPEEEHDIRIKSTENKSLEKMSAAQGALSYKHKFAKPQQEFTIDATVNYRSPNETSRNYQGLVQFDYSGGFKDSTVSETVQTIDNIRRDLNFDVQINYLHPFNEKLSLEVGYQGKLQWQRTFSEYDSRFNPYQDTSINFAYLSHNHGVYANLMGKFGPFTFQVSGRFEGDFMTAEKQASGGLRPGTDGVSNYSNTFGYKKFRFYPAVHLSYKIGKMQELQLSYSRRVNRPGPWNLDPFVDYSSYPSSIRYGNPALQPEDIHSVELNYSLFVKQSSFFVTAYYRHMDDVIRRYQFETESDGDITFDHMIMVNTFRNYAKANTYGFDISYEQQLLRWWRMSLSGSLHQNFTSDEVLTSPREGLSYRANFSTTMNLPKDFVLQFSVRYRGPMYMGQTRMDQNVTGEIALRKSFLNKKLNVALRVRDLFHTQKWGSTVTGDGFVTERLSRSKGIYSTALFVTVSYKLNKGIMDRRMRSQGSEGESGYGGGEGDM